MFFPERNPEVAAKQPAILRGLAAAGVTAAVVLAAPWLISGTVRGAASSLGHLWPTILGSRAITVGSGHGFARWVENLEAGSAAEKAIFRLMTLPGGQVLFRRPAAESIPALGQTGSDDASLYSLRALEEENGQNFDAAEKDWKTWAAKAADKPAAYLDLADFYQRRLRPADELAALEAIGASPVAADEKRVAPEDQRAWKAWARTLTVVDDYALGRAVKEREYAAWSARYPQDPRLYQQQLGFQLEGRQFDKAAQIIAQYRKAFPGDEVYPVEAEAQLATAKGTAADGLAVYERSFRPDWPADLVNAYLGAVSASGGERAMADRLRAKLAADGNDWQNAVRLFDLEQHRGQLEAAKAVLSSYRERKDASGATWTPEELGTFSQLYEGVSDYPEAARFYYAQAADEKHPDSQQRGIAGLARILLAAPEQPLRLGAANLAMYKSIARMDRGPGYLNGILSLWLNTQGPDGEFASENQTAQPYFRRARAAELVADLDKRFPASTDRPALHLALMHAYQVYGENDAVIREGEGYLAQFPKDPQRITGAMELADAYVRTGQTQKEFALYQQLLKELAAAADGVPLGDGFSGSRHPGEVRRTIAQPTNAVAVFTQQQEDPNPESQIASSIANSASYQQVLDRYLSRLVSLQRLPDALAVLKGELDRNPQDPGLYQRLADFFEQNALNAHVEEVYQKAIDHFQETGWYARLARFYLRSKRKAEYGDLTKKVTGIFAGTELEDYLKDAPAPDASMGAEVSRFALTRFPHNLTFVRRLLNTSTKNGVTDAEREQLLWAHWAEATDLRNDLLQRLSCTGKLASTLASLNSEAPEISKGDWAGLTKRNPAAGRLWVEANLWQSHYEQAVDEAGELARAYPADGTVTDEATSLYRSFAYFHPEDTDKAAATAQLLVNANPADLDRMARVGDIYADRERMAEAGPWFAKMAKARPGVANGYLQAATVYWDYFDFPAALAQLQAGREKLAQPTLYAYEAGAVLESEGQREAALREYLSGALADTPSDDCRLRLMALAKRRDAGPLIEAATGTLLTKGQPTSSAIALRVAVLDATGHKTQLEQELRAAVGIASTLGLLDQLSSVAEQHALAPVQELALRRQIALTTDPARALDLRYQLVNKLAERSRADASAEVDAIYRDHAKVLGVIRATVDYNWDHQRRDQAITVLTAAAAAAYPELAASFRLEAARKLTELGDTAKSSKLLQALLAEKPLDPAYEAAMQENLAKADDTAGLQAFNQSQMDKVRQASLDKDEKTTRIAQLRRGIITAATKLKKPEEATDQYIELAKAYSDDAGLEQEAALYALDHGTRDRLFAYFRKAVADSPRDARWPIVVARMATAAEDYPMAVDHYARAILLRPERRELVEAQADLYVRLHRLDEAVADYQKLYTLSYKDPAWMEKTAEVRARQGRTADAVAALEIAWIAGRKPDAGRCFTVAQKLEAWGLLDDARKYAEQGLSLAGDDLLVDGTDQQGAAVYARILARQRQADAAFTRLAQAREKAATLTVSVVAQQVQKEGAGAVTDQEWRQQRIHQREQAATGGFARALAAIGSVAGEFYTPEEKAQFAGWLAGKRGNSGLEELGTVYLPTAKAAGLEDLVAEWGWERIANSDDARHSELSAWISSQENRGLAAEAAAQIEKLAGTIKKIDDKRSLWQTATGLYAKLGNRAGELRTLQALVTSAGGNGTQDRYYALLLAQRPQAMVAEARNDAGAQYLVAHGTPDQAQAGVATRAQRLQPIWKSAYTALTGLYMRQSGPEIGQAFAATLGDATIGDRVDHPVNREQQLAGETWFYYAARYAAWLDADKDPRGDDYREAELEQTPESAQAYRLLADHEQELGRTDAALADYQDSLELHPDQPAVVDAMATIHWQAGRQPEALQEWTHAVELLAAEIDARHVPETFWGDFSQVVASLAAKRQYATIRPGIDGLLHTYIARNGEYMTDSLLEAAYHAEGDSLAWVLTAAGWAKEPSVVLDAIPTSETYGGHPWLKKQDVIGLRRRILELAEAQPADNPEITGYAVNSARRNLVESLEDAKDYTGARQVMAALKPGERNSSEWLGLWLAAQESDGRLDQTLSAWKAGAPDAPDATTLRQRRGSLTEKGSRAVMRFVYEQAIGNRELTEVNFLGLADIRLTEGDPAGAMELLRRMTLVAGDPWTESDAAAAVLEKHQRWAEAVGFLKPLAEASPWKATYRLRLAKAMLGVTPAAPDAVAMLAIVAADPNAGYDTRLSAASALHGLPTTTTPGSAELALVESAGCPSADAAAKPFFTVARETAAACAGKPAVAEKLLHEALANQPDDRALRLKYVWAAFDAGSDSRALIAAEPFLDSFEGYSYMRYRSASAAGEDDNGEPVTLLQPADKLKLYQLAEKTREKRLEPSEALSLVKSAKEFVKDPRQLAAFDEIQKRLQLDADRESENAARAPTIHNDLVQDHVVEPRILPGMSFVRRVKADEEGD